MPKISDILKYVTVFGLVVAIAALLIQREQLLSSLRQEQSIRDQAESAKQQVEAAQQQATSSQQQADNGRPKSSHLVYQTLSLVTSIDQDQISPSARLLIEDYFNQAAKLRFDNPSISWESAIRYGLPISKTFDARPITFRIGISNQGEATASVVRVDAKFSRPISNYEFSGSGVGKLIGGNIGDQDLKIEIDRIVPRETVHLVFESNIAADPSERDRLLLCSADLFGPPISKECQTQFGASPGWINFPQDIADRYGFIFFYIPANNAPPDVSVISADGIADGLGTQVLMRNNAFSPPSRTVFVGSSVTWINAEPGDGPAYSVTSGINGQPDGQFSSGSIPPGGLYQFTFSTAGSFRYYSETNLSEMKGEIIVLP